jgi:tRNA1Val (adenine37-N6)-methyltransferase
MPFRFKKFEIIQKNSAMKVGTDGVLLGAWADFIKPNTILDIGTGTGLIALMLAQRFNNATITALEIDKIACAEADLNFSNSAWNNRLKTVNVDFFKWEGKEKFDLLVCNPPFFANDLKSPDKQRAMARSGTKSGILFLSKVVEFMHEKSQVNLIIPADQFDDYVQKAETLGLYKLKSLYIIPTPSKPPKRVLLSFGFNSKNQDNIKKNYLIIEKGSRHQYSEEYKSLTKEFYLNLG